MERPSRRRPLEHSIADSLRTGRGHILLTGAGGQLGRVLAEVFPQAVPLARLSAEPGGDSPTLVLHAGAWTQVDEAESHADDVWRANVEWTRSLAALGAPLVYFSTDYVFDGRKRTPYVESDPVNPLSVYGRTKLEGEREVRDGWIVRSSWLFGAAGHNFVRTMLQLGAERDEVSVVDDQRGCPTYVGHLAGAMRAVLELPYGIYHVAADGDCTWAELAEAIFEEAGIECRVRRTTTEALGRPAPRPSYSVLRSERAETPRLPHWREGLRACLARLSSP